MAADSQVLVFMAFFALFAAAMVLLVRYQAIRRRQILAALAREMGYVFQSEDRDLLALVEGFAMLPGGSNRRCVNVVRGKAGRINIWLFDYNCISRNGSKSRRQEYTVCALRSVDLALPDFNLRREIPGMDRLGDLLVKKGLVGQGSSLAATFGAGDIDFAEDERFSRKFVLQGNEQDLRPLFAAEVRSHLLSFVPPVDGVEGRGDTMLLLNRTPLPPQSAREFIGQATALCRLLAGHEGPTGAAAS
jgi:hypothetical protein